MNITPLKTKPIVVGDELFSIIDAAIPSLKENSVVAITSKIVSICEGNVVKIGTKEKSDLIHEQAELYLPPNQRYNFNLSIKHHVLIPSAGIDESNGNGYYILWPQDPQASANKVREHLIQKYHLKNVGVIIVDSKTTPLRWGVTGVAIAHSGFQALNNYIGTPDIFGRLFTAEKVNVADGLAASAVLAMGEGTEQTPLALLTELPFVTFENRNPTPEELKELAITLEDDLYSQLLTAVPWVKGGQA